MLSLEKTFREKMQQRYAAAPLDAASFFRNYQACTGNCAALCCSGGSAFYMQEEADTVRRLVTDHREFFLRNGIPIDEPYLDEELDEKTGLIEIATSVRPMDYPQGLLPEHFEKTACVFRRASDGFCALQALSIDQGKPGWWYKPLACWLFPLEIERAGKPFIHVAHASTDEYADDGYPGFVGFTQCGTECGNGGEPAYKVLAEEIKALSHLLERDILSEVMAQRQAA